MAKSERRNGGSAERERLFIRVKVLATDGVVLNPCMHGIFTVDDIATVKDNGQAHTLAHLDQVGHGKLFPLSRDNQHLGMVVQWEDLKYGN